MRYKIPYTKEAGVPKGMDPVPHPKETRTPEQAEKALRSRYVTDRNVANQLGKSQGPTRTGQEAKRSATSILNNSLLKKSEELQPTLPLEGAPSENAYIVPQPTASEGTHPLAASPEEGLFAVPQERVVAQCNKLLKMKYTLILMYINYGDRIRAHFRDTLYAHFNEHMQEERTDAYHLAMKITALGGEPTPKIATIPDLNDMHQIFVTLLQAEKELLQELRALTALAGDNLSLKVTLEQMVLTDSQHADDLRRMMFCETGA